MTKFIPLNGMFKQLKQKKLTVWYDNLSFLGIFLLWTGIILIFGGVYYFLDNHNSYLLYTYNNGIVYNLMDSIYFSFITATSTGFGDIIPFGWFKIVAILEIIFGLVLLALVTSKLVSIKQNIAINEIYEISFYEKLNRIRSTLLVFRQNLGRLIEKIEDKNIKNRDVYDLYTYLSYFDNILNEISIILYDPGSEFKKSIDALNTELIFNSIVSSFEKLLELINMMISVNLEWKKEIIINLMHRCISINHSLFSKLNKVKNMTEKTIHELQEKNNKTILELEGHLK